MRALDWLAAALVGAIVSLAAQASAEMSVDAVIQKIEADYAVTVLRVKPMTDGGRRVFAVDPLKWRQQRGPFSSDS